MRISASSSEQWTACRRRKGEQLEIKDFETGDIITMKKKHPCGSFEWEILRVGADFRLKCLGCEHLIMLSRRQVEKNTKQKRKKP